MLIIKLKIKTSKLEEQVLFYRDVLKLSLLEKNKTMASFQVGHSVLVIEKSVDFTPYHFAINIPSNKIEEALSWVKSKVAILKEGDYEIHNFSHIRARSLYFYDCDFNIIELIARAESNLIEESAFSEQSFVGISEIGVPVDLIEPFYNELQKVVFAPVYSGTFERFCAMGDVNGLFICINKNIKDWFPVNDKAYSSEFEIDIKCGKGLIKLKFMDERILFR